MRTKGMLFAFQWSRRFMHKLEYDVNFARRHFTETVAKGTIGAGMLMLRTCRRAFRLDLAGEPAMAA
jgi:hypothetical protein